MSDFDKEMLDAGLNRSQRKFCKLPVTRNIRLLAPAGSGKTFSLLWRCKFIVEEHREKGKTPPRFLIVTFTRSARFELESRIKTDPAFEDIRATIRTLNSWGWEQNKKIGKKLVVGRRERKELIANDLNYLCRKYGGISPLVSTPQQLNKSANELVDLIDELKNLGFTHKMGKRDYRAQVKLLKKVGLESAYNATIERIWAMEGISTSKDTIKEDAVWEFFDFWKKAVVQLEKANRFTLEDQKYWARIYLENNSALGNYPQGGGRYTHIFVDEFQDINPLDIALLKAISIYHGRGKQTSMTIAGDDDQAIFGWRGTSPEFILDPDTYFGGSFVTAILDTNYRSPKKIVEYSSRLISYNKNRVPKEMKSLAKGKAYVKVVTRPKTITTLESTLALVHELIDDKGCENVALIGRKQTSLFPYQIMLSAENTKYSVAADLDIFDGEAMRSLQDIIQIVNRYKQNFSQDPIQDVLTIMNKIDRYQLSNKDISSLRAHLDKDFPETIDEVLDRLSAYPEPIKKMDSEDIREIILEILNSRSVYEFMSMVEKNLAGLDQDYTKIDTDNHYKAPQFFRLKDLAERYRGDFGKFNKDIERAKRNSISSRARESDDTGAGYQENQKIKIHLVTATRSKGHEYDGVIVLDADDVEWPNRLSHNMEEERRLFYVAMTRAKKYLYFSVSGEMLESRFLLEAGLI